MVYGNTNLTQNERRFSDNEIIVSKTDLSGKLTYGNRTFFEISGLEEHEGLGKQHNIVRHPDMPRVIFDVMWEMLKKGEEVFAYVINRAKNGDYYWVFAHITPSRDQSGQIVGFHSSRRAPNKQVIESYIKPLYRKLINLEKSAPSPKQGLQVAREEINKLIIPHKNDFNCFVFSLEKEVLNS